MTTFKRAFPSRSRSSCASLTSSFSNIGPMASFLKFITASKILKIGSSTNWLKARSRVLPSASTAFVDHLRVAGLKKLSPHSLSLQNSSELRAE